MSMEGAPTPIVRFSDRKDLGKYLDSIMGKENKILLSCHISILKAADYSLINLVQEKINSAKDKKPDAA